MRDYQYSFEKLEVWQLSVDLVQEIYTLTKVFPDEEKYDLVSQMRRAAISVSSNIAEGSTRLGSKDRARFTQLAYGSRIELLNQVIIGTRLVTRKVLLVKEQ
ncbi:MAG: four helix bundle protein [Saprospiraceae bacterium]|nr:four helix bundle protein [Saprospiraceae bacterium]